MKENMSEGEETDDYTILEKNDDGVEVVDEGATSEGAKNNDAEETGQAHEDNDDNEEEEE